jgi:hypothetical protein
MTERFTLLAELGRGGRRAGPDSRRRHGGHRGHIRPNHRRLHRDRPTVNSAHRTHRDTVVGRPGPYRWGDGVPTRAEIYNP